MRFALLLAVLLPLAADAQEAQGPRLAVVDRARSQLLILDATSGEQLAAVRTGVSPREVAISPDGRFAYVPDYGTSDAPGRTVAVIDIDSARVVRTIDLGRYTRPYGVAVDSAGTLWVVSEGTRNLLRIDAATGEVLDTESMGQNGSRNIVLAPQAGRIYVTNTQSGSMVVFDPARNRKVATVAAGALADGIAIAPDGVMGYVANRGSGFVVSFDADRGRLRDVVVVGNSPTRLRVHPDGRRLFVVDNGGALVLVDIEEWEVASRLPLGSGSTNLVFSPDASTAYITNTGSGTISVVDLDGWRVSAEFDVGGEPDGIAFLD